MLNTPPTPTQSLSPPSLGDGGMNCEKKHDVTQLGDTITQVQQREKHYNSIPSYCGKNVMFQPDKPESMVFMGCNRLSCPRCRPKIKAKIMDKIVETAEERHLQRQLVLTCPGKKWRKYHTPDESFKWLNKKWISFKILYKRETGKKLHYIKLPRSQESGYCHLHVLVNTFIKKSLLEDLIERVGMGTNYKINYVDMQRLRSYLRNDLMKEHEWFIPTGMRHLSASMELVDGDVRKSILIMWDKSSGCWISVIFGKRVMPQVKYDFVYDIMQNYGDRPPPHWFFLYCFSDMNRIQDSVGYVADLMKQYLPSSRTPEVIPTYRYQKDLIGKMHRITTEFEPMKCTSQIKFKRG